MISLGIGMVEIKPGKGSFELMSESPERTIRLGRILGEMLYDGAFVALVGGLGAGKTVLAKGIALGLGVEDEGEVTSPSFVLVNEYRGRVPIYHVDLYRLESPAEVEGTGWEDFLAGPGVVLVEWADRAENHLPPERIEVHLDWAGEEKRRLLFFGLDEKGRWVVEQLRKVWLKGE
jgi:tRNA threonylcarbamoyladenosine biosynthesis protein TsaE